MSLDLSPYAIHRIFYFLENDDRRGQKEKKTPAEEHPRKVSDKWDYVYERYFVSSRPPPPEKLRSLEVALLLTDNENAMQAVFEHIKPIEFDQDHPIMLLHEIVDAFQKMQEEPTFLDVAMSDSSEPPRMDISTMWPQVYVDYFPCSACAKIDTGVKAKKPKRRAVKCRRTGPAKLERFAVETFHIPSKSFAKQLTVELRFIIVDGDFGPKKEKGDLRKITIRLGSASCICSPSGVARNSKSHLLLPEFALEVYGFLDRAHIGASLLANRGLNELILTRSSRLPAHHLALEFKDHVVKSGCMWRPTGAYGLFLRHFGRDSAYTDVRLFKISSTAGPSAECALIRRYLRNSHVAECESLAGEFRFCLKMLAALVDHNFSMGLLWMGELNGPRVDHQLSDYRSLDAVFNGAMRLDALELFHLSEHSFAGLVKTTDLFRMAMVQRLKALKLHLIEPRNKSEGPRRWVIMPPSLWIAGIHLLHNAERFVVMYESKRHLRTIGLKLVQLCEKFERGEISDIVREFEFSTPRVNARRKAFPFKADNKVASEVKGVILSSDSEFTWDVYRFKNPTTGAWITACAGRDGTSAHTLRIVKGEISPKAACPRSVVLCAC